MKNKLNILMVCKSLPWRFLGGIQTHTWDLSRAIAALGHHVNILTGGSLKKGMHSFTQEGVTILEIPYLPGRYIKPFALLAEEFCFNITAKNWIKENENKYDIIHLQGRSGMLYALSINHKPIVTTIHGLIEHENKYLKRSLDTLSYQFIAPLFEHLSVKKSNSIISVSNDLKQNLISGKHAADNNIKVIFNGINPLKMKLSKLLPKKRKKLLFVGRLHPVKGLKVLVKTMALVHHEIELDIIGEGLMRKELEEMIANYQLQHRIKLLGALPRNKVYDHMRKSMALILTSRYETQGIVLLEALLNGIPVVASNLSAIRETINDGVTGLLCDPDSPSQFASSVQYIYDHPTEAQIMASTGCDMVKTKFTWNKIALKTISVYEDLLVA